VKRQILATALLGISLGAGCSDDSGPTSPAASTFPQTIHGTVGAASPVCEGNDDTYGEVQYPCERFTIVAPRRGTLVARLTWSGQNNFLRLGAGSRDFVSWNVNPCSSSTCETRILVAEGGTSSLAVALDTGRSRTASQAFDVTVSLE
jgi:hypothetical protein